ncbi:DNA topoisomerase III [Modicisalibacter tunisiensis]|uniref:DNA topoisomerase III n=1 Tax=Modicisalibacter tunisiensis TaxID=390637 RepID=UPI001CCD6F60|nr:DNA topoisomerase III [Modicisalibacter tunisiensis]MBZ9537941.1 DNA topoisomerase III [Modicisalibacter tunisiensis]
MRLIIAEKPSLARAIADALPGRTQRRDGALEVGDTWVSWCLGHLLEPAPPDAYDPRYKQWRLDHLPIVPERWRLVPRHKARGQLKVLRELIKRADSLVHAGDPDREGQLLVQEVIEHLGWRGPVARLLISDLNRPAVTRALDTLQDNRRYQPLYEAARARSRADWLYGINLSRAWTLTGRQAGHDGVLSVGRVQTPVLGLVARRDIDIARFEPRPYHVLWADLSVAAGELRAWWQPQEHHPLDDQGRLLARAPAEALLAHLPGAEGRLTQLDARRKRQNAPLPYSLSALQVDAARRHRFSAQQVLDICQALYERHQLITYPRSDCRYLPEDHRAGMGALLERAGAGDEALRGWLTGADFTRRPRAFDDARVGAHHALAPTGKPFVPERLSQPEAAIYRLIARNVIAQFYPMLETREVKAEFTILDETFRAQGREILVAGWKPLFTSRDEAPPLPPLTEGEPVTVADAGIDDKLTRPPEPFTDASLIKAMMNIARYVEEPAVKRTLRDTDGLGTEATRAAVIETLLKRGYLVRQSGNLRATATGHALIRALPDAATRPERTALWEQRLRAIAEADEAYQPFLDGLLADLRELLAAADAGRMRQALGEARNLGPAPKKPASGKPASGKPASKKAKASSRRRRSIQSGSSDTPGKSTRRGTRRATRQGDDT